MCEARKASGEVCKAHRKRPPCQTMNATLRERPISRRQCFFILPLSVIAICKIKISVANAMNVSWILLLRLLGVQEERQETREAATTTGACALAAKRAGAATSNSGAATR